MSEGTYVIEGNFGFKVGVSDTDKGAFLDVLIISPLELDVDEYYLGLTTNFHFEGYLNNIGDTMDSLRKLFKENANIIEWASVGSSYVYTEDYFTLKDALEFEEDE